MRPLTARRPKVMLPVAGRPLIAWLVGRCLEAGVSEFVVVTHYEEAAVRKWFRAHPPKGARVRFVHQPKPNGTGAALNAAARAAGSDFLVLYGDTLPDVAGLRGLAENPEPALGAWKVADASPYGALEVSGRSLRRIVEKSRSPPSKLINAGAYRFTRDLLAEAERLRKSPRGEFELTDAVNAFLRRGGRMRVHRFSSWAEAGRPWDLLGIQGSLMADPAWTTRQEGKVEPGVVLQGPVEIGPGTVVKSGTVIEGPVTIGRDCRIGPHAYLRGATSIGDGCHVGASVEVKNSILFEGANVPHLSYVGDSVLGSEVNLGAGTSIANLKVTPHNVRATLEDGLVVDTGRRKLGAIIGDGTKIGINCSLAPGTIVGADCLVGMGRSLSGWVRGGTRMLRS